MYTLLLVVFLIGGNNDVAITSQYPQINFSTHKECTDTGKKLRKDLSLKEKDTSPQYTRTIVKFSCIYLDGK